MELKTVKRGCDRMRGDSMLSVSFRIWHAGMQVLVRKSETNRGSLQRTDIATDNPSKPESRAHESPLWFMQTVTLRGIQPIYYMRIKYGDLQTGRSCRPEELP